MINNGGGMRKKLIFTGTCIAVICIILAINITIKHGETKRIHLDLNKNDVQRINITSFPPLFDAFDITDKGQIGIVVDYLTSLNIVKTKINPVSGGGFIIKVFLKDGTVREFNHNGNIYVIEKMD